MSTDNTPSNPLETVPSPTTPPGEMRHSETLCDIEEHPTLTDAQLQAIDLTVQGYSDVRIAQELSIERRTLWRWKTQNELYQSHLTHARFQRQAGSVDRYQLLLDKSTVILSQALHDPDPQTRFRAANIVFNMAGAFKPLQPTLLPALDPAPVLPPAVG